MLHEKEFPGISVYILGHSVVRTTLCSDEQQRPCVSCTQSELVAVFGVGTMTVWLNVDDLDHRRRIECRPLPCCVSLKRKTSRHRVGMR